MQAARGSGAAEILSWAVAQRSSKEAGDAGGVRCVAGPGPAHLTPRDRGSTGGADCRTTRSPDEFAHVTAVTKEAAPLCNSLLMRHSDEMAPRVRWPGHRAGWLRVAFGRARAEEVLPRGTGRQGDVTARMMLRLWD
jgi:hypothetical protein